MPQIIEVPELGEVEFPDEMSDDDIATAIRGSLAAPAASAVEAGQMPVPPPPAEVTQAEEQQAIEMRPAPQGVMRNAVEGVGEAAAAMVPRDLLGVASLINPAVMAGHSASNFAKVVHDIYKGEPVIESLVEHEPLAAEMFHAEQTPGGSKERFRAGTSLLLQVGMLYAGAKGALKGMDVPPVKAVAEQAEPDTAPPLETIAPEPEPPLRTPVESLPESEVTPIQKAARLRKVATKSELERGDAAALLDKDTYVSSVRSRLEERGADKLETRTWINEANTSHRFHVESAISANKPVNAKAVEQYGIELPKGYIREGDLYAPETIQPPAEPGPARTGTAEPAPAGDIAGRATALGEGEGIGPGTGAASPDAPAEVGARVEWEKVPSVTTRGGKGKEFFWNTKGPYETRRTVVYDNFKEKWVVQGPQEPPTGRARVFAEFDTPEQARRFVEENPPEPFSPGPGAASAKEPLQALAEAATVESADQSLGISAGNPFKPAALKNDLPATAIPRAARPEIEARWKGAKLEQQTLPEKIRGALTTAKESFTRHFAKLDPKTDGAAIDTLRLAETIPQRAQLAAANFIRNNVAGLGPKKYEVFSRTLILRDLIKDVDRGLHAGKSELPFGYKTRAELEADLGKFDAVVQANPDIKAALDKRQQVINAVRDELVKRDLLPEQVKDFDDYFHRQVLQYYALKEPFTSGAGRSTARVGSKGYQKGREGSAKDFNTSYIEAEFEVLSQAFSQMEMQDALGKLKMQDISPQLKAQAKNQNVDWQTLIPEDHTIWQPERGNYFYPANTLADKALEGFLKGTRQLTADDFKTAIAMGSKKPEWVIPKRLAETLDNFGPRPDTVVEKFVGAGIGKWKVWTLLNPFRAFKYNLNNMSGDLDIALAYDPAILKGAAKAAADSANLRLRGTVAKGDIAEMQKLDVIGSGFSVKEVPALGKDKWFSVLEGKQPNLIQRYWNSTKDFTQFREDILRIAAYRHFLEKINKGEKVYGASKKAEVDAVLDPKEKAAKLSRELIGDYGNVSVAGEWLRGHMIPFYSWMEINAPRYARLMKNLPDEGRGGTGRVAAVLGKKAATWTAAKGTSLALKASAMYMAVNIWNRTFFPDEEAELPDADRGQLHLILGRDDTGRIRSLRFQGALSDAMSWFGAENLPQDIAEVRNGKASIKDKVMDAMKAPAVKLFQGAQPISRTVLETLTGKSLYPNPLRPRQIRDRVEHASRALSVDSIYRTMAGKPTRPIGEDVLGLLTYTTDPGEAAYFTTRSMVQKYLEKTNQEKPGHEPNARSNALYYHKQALRFGDAEKAKKFLDEYMSLGGTSEGLKRSIGSASPLNGVPEKKRNEFLNSLTPEEQAITNRAEQWYRKVYQR